MRIIIELDDQDPRDTRNEANSLVEIITRIRRLMTTEDILRDIANELERLLEPGLGARLSRDVRSEVEMNLIRLRQQAHWIEGTRKAIEEREDS